MWNWSCVFHLCIFSPAFSGPAFSTPAFSSPAFSGPAFSVPHFPVLHVWSLKLDIIGPAFSVPTFFGPAFPAPAHLPLCASVRVCACVPRDYENSFNNNYDNVHWCTKCSLITKSGIKWKTNEPTCCSFTFHTGSSINTEKVVGTASRGIYTVTETLQKVTERLYFTCWGIPLSNKLNSRCRKCTQSRQVWQWSAR